MVEKKGKGNKGEEAENTGKGDIGRQLNKNNRINCNNRLKKDAETDSQKDRQSEKGGRKEELNEV